MKSMKKIGLLVSAIFFMLLCSCGNEPVEPEKLGTINALPGPVETETLQDESAPSNVVVVEAEEERAEADVVMVDGTGQGSRSDEEETAEEPSNRPITLDPSWEYASFSKINSGSATLYRAEEKRKGIVIGVNAGHGTQGGTSAKTYCHPDMTPKITGGTTAQGAIEAVAVSGGMSFNNGELESHVTLRLARMLKEKLLAAGYDVLMIRDGDDVQLDNVARTVICNNMADCHIAIHFDGDGLDYDKGCFYISVPDGLKSMKPVDRTWERSERLGDAIVKALSGSGLKIHNNGSMDIDLTQTSYSTIPSVDVEYGNQCSDTSDAALEKYAEATVKGIEEYFED